MNFLEQAAKVSGDGSERSADYGPAILNFAHTALLLNAYFATRPNLKESPITPDDVAVIQVLFKISRESNAPKMDNQVDIAGYINCQNQMVNYVARNCLDIPGEEDWDDEKLYKAAMGYIRNMSVEDMIELIENILNADGDL